MSKCVSTVKMNAIICICIRVWTHCRLLLGGSLYNEYTNEYCTVKDVEILTNVLTILIDSVVPHICDLSEISRHVGPGERWDQFPPKAPLSVTNIITKGTMTVKVLSSTVTTQSISPLIYHFQQCCPLCLAYWPIVHNFPQVLYYRLTRTYS